MGEPYPTSSVTKPAFTQTPPLSAIKPEKDDDADTTRYSKRRKNCPTALQNLQDLPSSDTANLSFTFDTKFNPCAPEFTPKFGSFNQVGSKPRDRDQRSCNCNDPIQIGAEDARLIREADPGEERKGVTGLVRE